MWVKIHSSSRKVIAICDEDLLGKSFEQGIKQLKITESFYKGEIKSKEETIQIMKYELSEGSTFNIVGKESISIALKAGIIIKEDILKVKNIPFVLIVN